MFRKSVAVFPNRFTCSARTPIVYFIFRGGIETANLSSLFDVCLYGFNIFLKRFGDVIAYFDVHGVPGLHLHCRENLLQCRCNFPRQLVGCS